MHAPVVVFDLDNTLGDFTIVSGLWPEPTVPKTRFSSFCRLMNKHLHVYSPILSTIPRLVAARTEGRISSIVMYTNNNGHCSWASAIAGHIGLLHGTRVFDAVIPGYREELGIEQCRSGPEKTYEDLCRCLGLANGTRVLFVDDQEHPGMRCEHVEYARVKPYYAHFRRSTRTRSRKRSTPMGRTRRVTYR